MPPSKPRSSNGADPDCAGCGGLGVYTLNVPSNDPRFGKLFDCECTAAYRAGRLQAICGLNREELRVTLDDVIGVGPGTSAMLAAAQAFVARPVGILTIWGVPGNAKTLVLQGIVNTCTAQGVLAIYVTFFDLVNYVRDAFNEQRDGRYESAYQRLMRFAAARVLVIDEVDKVKVTDWTVELETAIFDRRYRDGLAGLTGTVLAMNSNPDRLPEWIYSRLRDGRNHIVENRDPDMRRLMR